MFPMRTLLATAVAVLLPVSYALGSTDFSGKWVLDLHSSNSSDPMLERLGVPWIERKVAAAIKLESTYTQSLSLLTIHTHGPAFSRTEVIRLDNKPETKTEALTGPYTIRSRWSAHGSQLVSTISFRTKDGHLNLVSRYTLLSHIQDGLDDMNVRMLRDHFLDALIPFLGVNIGDGFENIQNIPFITHDLD
jgi:hypothetical protein